MKRLFTILTLLICVCSLAFATENEDISKYKLKEYSTVEEFQEAYLNKVVSYLPIVKTSSSIPDHTYLEPILGFSYDLEIKQYLVTNIIKTSIKKCEWLTMEWTIEDMDSHKTKTFTVFSNNYPNEIPYTAKALGEKFLFRDLPFYQLEDWKEEHKSEIGQFFENNRVKAKYEVIDLFLKIDNDPDKILLNEKKILKFYTVQNTITGEKHDYVASKAQELCFKEDLSGGYSSILSKVEKPSNPSVKKGKITIVEDKDKTKYNYEDNFISITIFCTSEKFNFILKNKSDNSIKIIWDDAAFVDYSGNTSRVMHSGIKYSQKEASQPASTIIKGATLDDVACPTANVYYSTILKDWVTKSMYPQYATYGANQIQLMLPIQIKDVVNEYIFVFDLKYGYNYPERLNLP